jgi:ferredoxin
LEARKPTDVELLYSCAEMLRDKGHAVISCAPRLEVLKDRYDRSGVVEVRCLGRVDESLLVALVVLDAESITLLHGDCESCPNTNGRKTYRQVQDDFVTLMRAWAHANPLNTTSDLPKGLECSRRKARSSDDVDGISRRQFFTQIRLGVQESIAEIATEKLPSEADVTEDGVVRGDSKSTGIPVVKVMRDGTLPHFIPNRRERLLDRLDHLGRPQVEFLDTRLWGHMRYDEDACDSCRMCATFCPTGAICKFDDPDGTMGIEHYPADCVQCRLCQDICPTGAITLESKVPVKELVEGVIERLEMKPPLRVPSAPDSIIVSIKRLFNDTNINDRP